MPSPNLTGSSANYDWGVFNPIVNGGNVLNTWRTLSKDEWEYVLKMRNTLSDTRFVKAFVCGIESVILFPDDWDNTAYELINVNNVEASFTSNEITQSDWIDVFEKAGAVLFLATGTRSNDEDNTSVRYVRNTLENGYIFSYWSTTAVSSDCAATFFVNYFHLWVGAYCARDTGRSVRLVQDANR